MNKDPKSILALILMLTVMPMSIMTMIGLYFVPESEPKTQEELEQWEKDHPIIMTAAKGYVLINVAYDGLEKAVETKRAVDDKIDTVKDVKASLVNKMALAKEFFADKTEPLGRFDARMVE